MGQATVLANLGEGLYRVQLNYDLTRINYEKAQLEEQWATYFTRLNEALLTLEDLRRAKAEAADGLDEVVKQWLDGLISKLNEEPPVIPPLDPNDPETGLPWAEAERAQDGPLFDAINAERTAASIATLTRDADLDRSILRHLRALGATGRIRHDEKGWDASDRARSAGYDFDSAVGVGQVLAFGTRGADVTVALWMRRSGDRALILSEDFTECGVAYVYNPRNPYSYLWGAVFAAPGAPMPTFVPPEPDPAEEAADEAESVLDKIPLPTVEGFEPAKLGEVAAEFGKAAQRVRAAENAVAALRVEEWDNRRRRLDLEALIESLATPIDAWCCRYLDDIDIGAVLDTAEVPGFYQPESTVRFTQMGIRGGGPRFIVEYSERAINLLTPGFSAVGRLHPVDNMTPAETFHAAAMEPGAVRWKPRWRYGIILDIGFDHLCTVRLNDGLVRQPRGVTEELPLDAADQKTITNVMISYPPCDSERFEVGDEVLVHFVGHDRDVPVVIGFRREPLPCVGGRLSWREVIGG
jgi:uncharacterized protein YkwD